MSRKPQDPRHQGLKAPEDVFYRTENIYITDLGHDSGKVSLQTLIGAWHKALKDHESQGHRIVQGPYFEVSASYGRSSSLAYKYAWDNVNYAEEKAAYDTEVATYEERLKAWKEAEEKKKNGPPPGIDDQIARAERRLANLQAVKTNQPIPYPEG